MKTSEVKSNKYLSLSLAILPFIALVLIGLIEGDITYHQRTFKTLLIFIFDFLLIFVFFIKINQSKKINFEKNFKYILYFVLYFVYIFLQFIVSYLSNETSYNREYFLANYIVLIIFSLFVFLYTNSLEDINPGLLVITLFFVILIIWAIHDVLNFREILTIKRAFPDVNIDGLSGMEKKDFLKNSLAKLGQFVSIKDIFNTYRPEFSFGNTDYFSGYVIGLMPLAFITPVIFFDRKKPFYENWISILTFVIAMLGILPLILSQTRAALFGFYIGVMIVLLPSLIIIYLKKLNAYFKTILFISFIFIFLVCPFLLLKFPPQFIATIFHRLVSTLNSFTFFLHDRINAWSGALSLFKAHPVFGAGLGTTYAASFKYVDKFFFIYSDGNSFQHSHGEYVEILGEAGITGLIFFLALILFAVYLLLKKVFSNKYTDNYRILCLGVSSGLISMLVHQFFSVSLRMSVTMLAYFFLLGLGIFLISFSPKALAAGNNPEEKEKHSAFFNKTMNKKNISLLLFVIIIFTIFAFIIFLPLLESEADLRSAQKSIDNTEELNDYIDKAIAEMPGNPYARTEKWEADIYRNIYSEYDGSINEKYFDVIKDNLDKLNSIIYGYQDIWDKYAILYQYKANYYFKKFQSTGNIKDYSEYKKNLLLVLENIDKSLQMNFLNLENHVLKIMILPVFNNKKQHVESIKDCFITKIYAGFAKKNLILKEQIEIAFGDINDLNINSINGNNIYYFTISGHDVERISDEIYNNYDVLKDYSRIKEIIDNECDKIINKLTKK